MFLFLQSSIPHLASIENSENTEKKIKKRFFNQNWTTLDQAASDKEEKKGSNPFFLLFKKPYNK